MNKETQELLNQAKTIALNNKKNLGTRYPKKLKTIAFELVNNHGLSYNDVIAFVPVSKYSVQRWSTTNEKKSFKKISVKNEVQKKKKVKQLNAFNIQMTILAVQSLLITLQLFLR